MKITIILVNYKCDKFKLQNCLDSIKINTEIMIVDHSHDFTLENLSIPANLKIKVIRNKNLGNGAGINCGVKNAKTRYVLYLDIDTKLSNDFFITLEDSIKKIDNFAVISPNINGLYNTKRIKKYGNLSFLRFFYNKFFFKIKLNKTAYENIKQVFFVSGAIMLIDTKNTFEKNIHFDENIFMFFEEDDFFHRCFKLGEKIFIINNLYAEHLDGSINDKSINYECFKKWHWENSRFYFLNKHYNKTLIFLIACKSLIKFSLKIVFFYMFNRNKFHLYKSRLNGLLDFYLKKKCDIIY